MYIGAAHYYFWKGMEAAVLNPEALKRPVSFLKSSLRVMCPVGGKSAEASREAFMWGFIWGLEIGVEGFEDFFKESEKEKPEVILDDFGKRVVWN